MKFAALVLAAGASTRLGEPKQMVQLGGTNGNERLLERAVRIASEARCSPVVVVLGARAGEILETCHLEGAIIVLNEGWAEGMGSSIRAGMAVLASDIAGVILMTCDQPAVTVEHLGTLIMHGLESGEPVASSYAGRRGVPAFLPVGLFAALGQLHGDEGARSLLAASRRVDLPGGELDVDTRELLEAARRRFSP